VKRGGDRLGQSAGFLERLVQAIPLAFAFTPTRVIANSVCKL